MSYIILGLFRDILLSVISGAVGGALIVALQGRQRRYVVRDQKGAVTVHIYRPSSLSRERDEKSDISSRGLTATRSTQLGVDWDVMPAGPPRK